MEIKSGEFVAIGLMIISWVTFLIYYQYKKNK
jgi:hypothetical protein